MKKVFWILILVGMLVISIVSAGLYLGVPKLNNLDQVLNYLNFTGVFRATNITVETVTISNFAAQCNEGYFMTQSNITSSICTLGVTPSLNNNYTGVNRFYGMTWFYNDTFIANGYIQQFNTTIEGAAIDGTVTISLNASTNANSYFNSGGNVGIGTTGPSYPLDVRSTSQWAAGFTATSSGTAITSSAIPFTITNSDQTDNNWATLFFNDAVSGAAAVVIGTQFIDHTNNYGNLAFWTRGSSNSGVRMQIDRNGDVGIGTTSPTAMLDVSSNITAGNMTVRGNLTIKGQVPTGFALCLTTRGVVGSCSSAVGAGGSCTCS